MMYQKIIVPIDHGNRNMKTEHKIFTSGFVEGDCRPALGEYLQYNGRYYALTEQRIPYMRDKTLDDRFFILTLFAVAMEAEKQMLNTKDTLLQVALPVGLPPKHYGALYRKFEDYFMGRGIQQFTYKGIPYQAEIVETAAFPQDYAAAMTVCACGKQLYPGRNGEGRFWRSYRMGIGCAGYGIPAGKYPGTGRGRGSGGSGTGFF